MQSDGLPFTNALTAEQIQQAFDDEGVAFGQPSTDDSQQPVFNLRVADHHIYFVGDQTSVLVHNESAEGEEPVAEGQPNGVIVGQESQYAPGVDLYDQNGRKLGTIKLNGEGKLVVENHGNFGPLQQPIEAIERAFANGRGPKDLDVWFRSKVAQHLRGRKYNQLSNFEQQQVQQQLSAWKNFLDSWLKYEREGGKISGSDAVKVFQAIATVRELEGIIGMHDWGGKTAQESDYIPAKAAMRQKLEAKLAGTRAGSIERMYLQEELELCKQDLRMMKILQGKNPDELDVGEMNMGEKFILMLKRMLDPKVAGNAIKGALLAKIEAILDPENVKALLTTAAGLKTISMALGCEMAKKVLWVAKGAEAALQGYELSLACKRPA